MLSYDHSLALPKRPHETKAKAWPNPCPLRISDTELVPDPTRFDLAVSPEKSLNLCLLGPHFSNQ